jgi:CMP-N,N'-diacetyllegionaminic acid synthase
MGKVLAIIPARSGSKSVKDKNIREINGKPMIAYSIEHAKASKLINRVIVSTDSEVYAQIVRDYGAETPFIRPAEYAMDTSLDLEVFEHALSFLEKEEGYVPDLVVQLRPTYPIRNVKDIDQMITTMLEDESIDSMRCIAPAKEIAYKMWHKDENGTLSPIMKDIKECYNMPRQELPKVYYQNACIDVIRTEVITKRHSMSGDKIVGYEMEDNFDIDTEEEFRRAEEYLKITAGNKTFVFDIDGVIAKLQKNLDYGLAEPNEPMIRIINKLYDYGNKIVLFTARGYVTGINWSEITKNQMQSWGVKYHELKFGKPNADYYVDDKMLSMDSLYQMFE